MGSAHSKPHIFRPKFNQKFILFLMPHSGPHFSTFWRVLMPKCSILGPPCRPAASQNGIPNRSSIAKRLKTNDRGTHFFWYWKTTCFQYHFWSVPGHHFGRFGMDFSWFPMDFCIMFIKFSINFWRPFCTPLKPHALTILATQSADSCPQRR